jgi:hypothetical protein
MTVGGCRHSIISSSREEDLPLALEGCQPSGAHKGKAERAFLMLVNRISMMKKKCLSSR